MMMFFNSKHGKFCQNTDFCWTAPNIRKTYLYKRQLLATIRKHGASCSMHTPKTERNTLSFKYFKGISIIKSKNNNLQSTLRGLQLLNESKKSLWITLQDQADSLKHAEKKKMVQHKHLSTFHGEKYSRYWVISIACTIRSKHHFSNRDCYFCMDLSIPTVQTSSWLTHRSLSPKSDAKAKTWEPQLFFFLLALCHLPLKPQNILQYTIHCTTYLQHESV